MESFKVIKKITPNRRVNLINAIEDVLEDSPEGELSPWAQGYLEDMQKRLRNGFDLTVNQYQKLLDFVEV